MSPCTRREKLSCCEPKKSKEQRNEWFSEYNPQMIRTGLSNKFLIIHLLLPKNRPGINQGEIDLGGSPGSKTVCSSSELGNTEMVSKSKRQREVGNS